MATITKFDARKIASLSKPEGRQALKDCLKCDDYDEDQDMRRAIHLDFLYDTIMFGSEKGFTWENVVHIVEFANILLGQVGRCDKITDILSFYSGQSVTLCEQLGERDYKIYSGFIFGTILPHFKLYKLVFSIDRDQQFPHVTLKVEPPFDAKNLQDTKPLKVWDYEQQVEELQRKECERANQRLTEKEKKLSAIENKCKEPLTTTDKDQPLDKQKVEGIIQEVIQRYMLASTENMLSGVQELQEGLEYKLEVTSLPRPHALGAPPRFSNPPTVKTPVTKPGKATPSPAKSPKPGGSRASSRNKKK